MPNSSTAALAADLPFKAAGRALNLAGVAFLATSLAMGACLSLTAVERTGAGLFFAAVLIAGGELLSRRFRWQSLGGDEIEAGGAATLRGGPFQEPYAGQLWFFGTALLAAGYALAVFFTQATYYLSSVAALSQPYLCWVLETVLALAAVLQLSGNRLLRWAAVPLSLYLIGCALLTALADASGITFLGATIPAVASVTGVVVLAGLSALYKKLQLQVPTRNASLEGKAVWLLFSASHELYFFLAAMMALALPKYCSSLQYAPLWWAAEMPLLLAISWRSNSFIKHGLVMAIWALSAVLLLVVETGLAPLVMLAVPVSGLVMALTYCYASSSWRRWQRITGYHFYLYGSLALAVLVPGQRLAPPAALPYWLVEVLVLLLLSLKLSDRLLQAVSAVGAIAALVVFASTWHDWGYAMPSMVATGCYALSLLYGHIKVKGGIVKSELSLFPGSFALSDREAGWLEKLSGAAGYITLLSGSYVLIGNPYNTAAWGIEAFALIAFGFLTQKIGHRASGLLTMGIASIKLTVFDLSGQGTLFRTLVSFAAVGACCIAAGIFYLVEYSRLRRTGRQ